MVPHWAPHGPNAAHWVLGEACPLYPKLSCQLSVHVLSPGICLLGLSVLDYLWGRSLHWKRAALRAVIAGHPHYTPLHNQHYHLGSLRLGNVEYSISTLA